MVSDDLPRLTRYEREIQMRSRELVRLMLEERHADAEARINALPDVQLRDVIVGAVSLAASLGESRMGAEGALRLLRDLEFESFEHLVEGASGD